MNDWKLNYREGKERKAKALLGRIFFSVFWILVQVEETLKLASVVPLGHCDTSSRMEIHWSWSQHPLHPEELAVHPVHPLPSQPFPEQWVAIPPLWAHWTCSALSTNTLWQPEHPRNTFPLLWLDSPKLSSTIIVHKNVKGDFPWQPEFMTLDIVFCQLFFPVKVGYWSTSLRKWNRQEFRVTSELFLDSSEHQPGLITWSSLSQWTLQRLDFH